MLFLSWQEAVVLGTFLVFALAVSVADARKMLIPDVLNATAFAALLLLRIFLTRSRLALCLLGAAASVLLFLAVRFASKGRMGWGDVKFSAVCGIFAGHPSVFAGYAASCLFAAVFVLFRFVFCKEKAGKPFPFGPFMASGCAAAYIVMLCIGR